MLTNFLLADTIGLFMQMSVVAVCSIFLVVRVGLSSKVKQELRRRRHRRRQASEDDRMELDEFSLIYRLPYAHEAEGVGKDQEPED